HVPVHARIRHRGAGRHAPARGAPRGLRRERPCPPAGRLSPVGPGRRGTLRELRRPLRRGPRPDPRRDRGPVQPSRRRRFRRPHRRLTANDRTITVTTRTASRSPAAGPPNSGDTRGATISSTNSTCTMYAPSAAPASLFSRGRYLSGTLTLLTSSRTQTLITATNRWALGIT